MVLCLDTMIAKIIVGSCLAAKTTRMTFVLLSSSKSCVRFSNPMGNHSGKRLLENRVPSFRKVQQCCQVDKRQFNRAANITERKTTGNHVCLAGRKNLFYEILSKKKTEQFLKCLLYLKTLRKKTNKRYPKMFHLC